MALAYRDSAQVFGTTSSTNITIPATVQVGDLLVMQAGGGWAPTIPAGWTQDYLNNSASNFRGFVAYRVAQAGDAGATVTVTWENSYNHVVQMIAISGGTTLRTPTIHNHASSGGTSTVGSISVAIGDMAIYIGANRQCGGPPSLTRGTTVKSASDGGGNTSAGVVAHETFASGAYISNTFTTPSSGSGYIYSLLVVSDGGTPSNYALVESNYAEALLQGSAAALIESNYAEALIQGTAAARVESNYVEALIQGSTSAQVLSNYVEIIGSSANAQIETVYAETLASAVASGQMSTIYAEALMNSVASAQLSTIYTEALISAPRLQMESVYAEALSGGTPNIQTESVYSEVLSGGTPNIQTESVYAEVLVSLTVFSIKRGWGITSI